MSRLIRWGLLLRFGPILLRDAKALREAQRAYMADRGNEAKGKAVAEAATTLDHAIALIDP